MQISYLVAGGGPVGLWASFKILSTQPNARIILFEHRDTFRPQTLIPPFQVIADLPLEVRDQMYNEKARKSLLEPQPAQLILPSPNYRQTPWFCTGAFQEFMSKHLQKEFVGRFFTVKAKIEGCAGPTSQGGCHISAAIQAAAQEHPVALGSLEASEVTAMICTAGGASGFKYRTAPASEEAAGRAYTPQGDGVYLTFRHEEHESYVRNNHDMDGALFDKHGIHYLASNNRYNNAQIYTYPKSPLGPSTALTKIFEEMPDTFRERARFGGTPISLTGDGLYGEDAEWFAKYREALLRELDILQVPLPDHSAVSVFYAQRSEWYWAEAVAEAAICDREGNIFSSMPVFFLGDSAGCTDYWKGQSGGRGLIAASNLAEILAANPEDTGTARAQFSAYWHEIVDSEFNKPAEINLEPAIIFKYKIQGREVLDDDGKVVKFGPGDFEKYQAMVDAISENIGTAEHKPEE